MKAKAGIAFLTFLLVLSPGLFSSNEDLLGSALDLVMQGDPAGAVNAALEVARQHPDHLKAWYLCGMLRFHELGDYPGAVDCLDRVTDLIESNEVEFPEIRHVYRGRGLSYYLMGDYAKAEADLRAGIELDPDDVHGQLLRYLAAKRAKLDGEKPLRTYADTHESDTWPHPLVRLYLGHLSPDDCLAAAVGENRLETRGNLCEAHFYIAELYRLRGDEKRAATHFEKCLQTGMEKRAEFRLAREELARLSTSGNERRVERTSP